jgi:hypothetical protein
MSKLVVTEQSQKSINYLDKLFADEQNEKLSKIITSTSGEPLKRLLKAAIDRYDKMVVTTKPEPHQNIINMLVLANQKGESIGVDEFIDDPNNNDAFLQLLLTHAIVRKFMINSGQWREV